MAVIHPFRGVRYEISQVGALSDVVAPPYDVIDADLQNRLYEASPYNLIRLELNRAEEGDGESSNRYTRAAGFLKDWRRRGVLFEEPHPAFYVYQQTYQVEGRGSFTRTGFLGRIRLERFGEGAVYPHEQTLAGPKADRLSLYRATGFNLSPIFGLYPDPENLVIRAIEAGIQDRTPLIATDHLGVVNKLWVVTDQQTHTIAQGLMAEKPVFIADGHHRYETSIAYRDERQASGLLTGPDDPANFAMMMFVGMSDPGLLILPTHRLAKGFPGLTADVLAERLAPEFEIERVGSLATAWEAIEANGDQDVLGFGTIADGQWLTARLRSDAAMDRLAADHSADWRSLGVSILQVLVFDHLLKDLGRPSCGYVHTLDEVRRSIADGDCGLACLVPPAGMDHVAAIASNLEKMPAKSTYFYPKLLSGLVLNPVSDDC